MKLPRDQIALVCVALVFTYAGVKWAYDRYQLDKRMEIIQRQRSQGQMINDARLIGNSAQQYFLSTGQKIVTFTYDSATGKISGPLKPWLANIRQGLTFHDTTIESGNTAAFSMSLGGAFDGQPVTFSDEGKTTLDPTQ